MHESFSCLSCSGIGRLTALGAVSLIIALCVSAAPAGAHSPAGMLLAYHETAGELVVTITHQVGDPATHYVREVRIRVDGQMLKTIPYTSQPSATTFTYSYPLQVQAGNSVKVDASCILGGSITRTLVVPGSAGSIPIAPDLQAPTRQAAVGMIPVLSLVLLLIWRKRERGKVNP